MGVVTRINWRVEGMDCAACVAKVTKAVERLPGVSDVAVNLMAERMSVSLDIAAVSPEQVAAQVASLGYRATPVLEDAVAGGRPADEVDHDHGHPHDHPHAKPSH